MRHSTSQAAPEDPRVLQAAREYLAELEAGRVPDRLAYLARHPDLATALAECFDGIEMAHAVAVVMVPLAPHEPEPPSSTLGDFQIVREVGRGGMGIVYEAVQLSLGRRVALKVLPFAAGLDARHLQRFRTEAHAAAGLHHTNIVPVHAVGCERGVHFYAMQLIDGRSLAEVIHEMRGETNPPEAAATGSTIDLHAGPTRVGSSSVRASQRSGRALESFRTAARLVAQVADALNYAHEAGVVHRDVKPANLLLDGKGTVWVTDFGLAQVAADVTVTQTGDVLGTLRYMSPEQAAGQRVLVDHRTDVYSLGATLYELLTLEPIFSGQDRRALLHQILEEEPRPPRQLDRSIPVELETIVLKAVAKVPEERYATAAEMAADLRRFLDEQPILARRPSLVERARKWMRRHPSVVGAAVVFLVFVIVVLGATTALVASEKARTVAAYHREMERADQAEKRFKLAQGAADELIQVANEELADKPGMESLRKRLLQAALTYYEELIDQRREDASAQAELEATRDRVSQIVADLAILQGAGQIFLLKQEAVLEDLRVSAEQRERIAELSRLPGPPRQRAFRGHHPFTPEQWRQGFLRMARSNEKAIRAILTPGQLRRLHEIALQGRGLSALQDPEVVARLKLTAEQRERIRRIEGFLFLRMWRPRHHGRQVPRSREEQARKNQLEDQQTRDAALQKALAVLTKQQAKQWKDLTGEPFAGAAALPPHSLCPPGKRGPR